MTPPALRIGLPCGAGRWSKKRGRTVGLLDSGDRIVLIAGTGLAVTAHNMIVVHELE